VGGCGGGELNGLYACDGPWFEALETDDRDESERVVREDPEDHDPNDKEAMHGVPGETGSFEVGLFPKERDGGEGLPGVLGGYTHRVWTP